jgi:glutathione S-transferase
MLRPHILYGMPASLYTGKPRAYMRKQGIEFIEVAMGSAHFREHIVPKIGRFIVPVLETPAGVLIQDGAAIIDHFESLGLVKYSTQPPTPRQAAVARIFELFGGEGLLRPAMHYRWNFPAENDRFLRFEFGRHLAPGAKPEEQNAVFEFASGRMKQAAAIFGVSAETAPVIEAAYGEFLSLFDAHCAASPYLLGAQPSRGDYGLIAALFAHLGRDPKPADLMRRTAPAAMRWVERMNAPGLDMAEYPSTPPGFAPDDAIPDTLRALLRYVAEEYQSEILAHVAFVNDYLARETVQEGGVVGGKPNKRSLGQARVDWRGHMIQVGVFPYRLWLLQRVQDAVDAMPPQDRAKVLAMLDDVGLRPLVDARTTRRIERGDNCEVWGAMRTN